MVDTNVEYFRGQKTTKMFDVRQYLIFIVFECLFRYRAWNEDLIFSR